MTAISFVVDERVFNKIKYPDYEPNFDDILTLDITNVNGYSSKGYKNWVEDIGGDKNVWLREFLKQFRLL